MPHPCTDFWKTWSDCLFDIFDHAAPPIEPGDGCRMSIDTYNALCNLMWAIEDATGRVRTFPSDYLGQANVLPPGQEPLLLNSVMQMLVGLQNDHNDLGTDADPVHHAAGPLAWIIDGNAETDPADATKDPVKILIGDEAPKPLTDLLGRIKSALGSEGTTL
jgi:hypothetical protein